MKNYTILKIVALALFLIVPVVSIAATNVVYVNGIQNTKRKAIISTIKVSQILGASENHLGDEKKSFSVRLVFNPVGFYASEDGPDLKQDRMEMFLLKTAEELYGEDFQKIMVPFNESRSVDVAAATRVVGYLDDMTPGSNSLEVSGGGSVSDEDMSRTKVTAQSLVSTIKALDSAVVVAHSQGNLLANLAYAEIVSEFGDEASKMIRVVNVANTSEFSVNSLNFTHAGDLALYSNGDSLDASLETMPSKFLFWRITPKCENDYDYCNFTIASPTFQETLGGLGFLRHTFVTSYLSEEVVFVMEGSQYDFFTPGAERFVDRFEDFVYAAAESLEFVVVEPPVVVDELNVPTNLTVTNVTPNQFRVEWQGSGAEEGFELRFFLPSVDKLRNEFTVIPEKGVTHQVVNLPLNGREWEVWIRAFLGEEYSEWVKESGVSPSGESPVVEPPVDLPPGTVMSGGRIWMDRNLGASRVAISSTDSEAYGDLYQWGRGADGHQLRISGTTSIRSSTDDSGHGDFIIGFVKYHSDWRNPQNNNLWQGVYGINNPCPVGFRLPTWTEISASMRGDDPLDLVFAGWRDNYDGDVEDVGRQGRYWTSTVDIQLNDDGADRYFFSRYGSYSSSNIRKNGYSVRCIMD